MGGHQPSEQRKAEQEAHRSKGEPCGVGRWRLGRRWEPCRLQERRDLGTEGWPGKGMSSTRGHRSLAPHWGRLAVLRKDLAIALRPSL